MMPVKSPRTLEDYWMIARRRRWWLILPLFSGWVLVFGASWFVTRQYRSETVIIVEPQRAAEQYVSPNISADVQERLQSMMQQILSRTRLQKVIERFHLYGIGGRVTDDEGLIQQMRRDIKIELVAGRPGELSAFKISYSAPAPLLAQQVTNELSSLFIGENMRSRQAMSENTTEFLEGQLRETRNELSQQEERLRDFKSRHLGELPEQVALNTQILSGLQTRLQIASEALEEANQQKLYLESIPGYQVIPGENHVSDQPATPAAVSEQINRLKAQLAEMTTRYTANHPDVRRIKNNIDAAEKLRQQMEAHPKAELAQGAGDEEPGAGSSSLQLKAQFAANAMKIAHQQHEIQQLEKEIQDYQSRLNMAPLREQGLAEITRDYSQAKSAYESLLSKETQSEMATNLEKRQQGELFRIIDPPNLPQKPYKPDRLKFSFLGLVMGALLAFGLTGLMEIVDVRIYRDQDFYEIATIPILAGIPPLQNEEERQKELMYGWIKTAAASALILAIPAITLFTYHKG
jgi:polysaccharide chain length determinant protein (PEP-CTERM system associated)